MAGTERASRLVIGALAGAFLCATTACAPDAGSPSTCAEALAAMEACYPGLSETATCTDETLATYAANGLGEMSCEQIHSAAKADEDTLDICPEEGKHPCGGVFCCSDDYGIHWRPTVASQWEIIPLIQEYQQAAPREMLAKVEAATRAQLLDAFPVTFDQEVDDGLGKGPRSIAVEITTGIVELPLETFLARLPADRWGVNLDHYLGGEVEVYERDDQGRPVRQVERMALSPLPWDIETPISNMDMTKVERIVYEEDSVTVYWRVMNYSRDEGSDNRSTETDVGSVSFVRHGGDETKIVWHSAHRIRSLFGIVVPNWAVRAFLGSFFPDQVREYRRIATER